MKTEIILQLGLVIYVFGHGGIVMPPPMGGACTPTSSFSLCGGGSAGAPCGAGNVEVSNPLNLTNVNSGDEVFVSFYQRIGHNATGLLGTYQIVLWETDESGNSITNVLQNITQPTYKDNIYYNTTVTIPQASITGIGWIQFIFNATANGAGPYYSCSALEITHVDKKSHATTAVPLSLMIIGAIWIVQTVTN